MKRDEAPLRAPVWIDVFTSEPDKSMSFYADLFGWEWDEPGFGGTPTRLDGVLVAGLMGRHEESGDTPDMWSVYLRLTTPSVLCRHRVPVVRCSFPPCRWAKWARWLAVLTASVRPSAPEAGNASRVGVLAEPEAPWFELHQELRGRSRLLPRGFDWDTHEMDSGPDFRYTTLGGQCARGCDGAVGLPPEASLEAGHLRGPRL
jgi:hypothetical protein